MKRLILAPHMDDEAMGCGGLLAKYPDECKVVVLTYSGEKRQEEFEKAMKTLKVTDYSCLEFQDGSLTERMGDVVRAIDEICSDYQPDELYLPFPSLHQDHIATYEAGMRSARISMSVDHWVPAGVLVYDVAVYDVNLYPTDLRWNVFESLTEEQADLKQESCLAYQSEIPSEVHPITSIKEMAAAVGRPRLLKFAEQYARVREVRR